MFCVRDERGAFWTKQCAVRKTTKHDSNKKLKESRLLFALNTSIIFINQLQRLNDKSYGG